MKFEYPPGATPIDPDEAAGLIPAHMRLQAELNEIRGSQYSRGNRVAFSRRRGDPLEDRFVHTIHRPRFDKTWKWAGTPRRSDKNIGVLWPEIHTRLRQMLGDTRAQIEHSAYPPPKSLPAIIIASSQSTFTPTAMVATLA